MLQQSLSEHFDKWNKACLLSLIAFSPLCDINTTLNIDITITWSFTLRYVIATTSLWCRQKISYNHATSIPILNRSKSRCKSNKKPMSPQYRVCTECRVKIELTLFYLFTPSPPIYLQSFFNLKRPARFKFSSYSFNFLNVVVQDSARNVL